MDRKFDRRTIPAALQRLPPLLSAVAPAHQRSITVGIYTAQQGEYVRKQIIPPFQAEHKCKVYTTQA